VVINQFNYNNAWVLLGTFDLDALMAESGRVNLVDVTSDTTVKEIGFTAIRWRSVESGPAPQPGGAGYDAPIGTAEERASANVWPGSWFDATGYAVKYPNGTEYHTGADLNLNVPAFDTDRGSPVYATADGVVAHSINVPGSWGGLIVIRHTPLPDGKPVYSRYAHVEQVVVKDGDSVARGQQIAVVGYYAPGKNYHLHFDISCTSKLDDLPRHWPGTDKAQVVAHYVDPKKFIAEHRPQ
jgi:murein DD-endopeptidase MepM/ murein hydrolase activator NlpD